MPSHWLPLATASETLLSLVASDNVSAMASEVSEASQTSDRASAPIVDVEGGAGLLPFVWPLLVWPLLLLQPPGPQLLLQQQP